MNRVRYYQKRRKKRKRIIIAYILRTLVGLMLIAILSLLICGGLFIYRMFVPSPAAIPVNRETSNIISAVNISLRKEEAVEFTVILDAGHGGKDIGTSSGSIYEKDINLRVAERVEQYLQEKGVRVVRIREDDTFYSLDERVNITNNAAADLFVSIHCNYYKKDAKIKGFECYYYPGSQEGKKYADSIMAEITASHITSARGTREEQFVVIRHSNIPAVLLEIGYLSNAEECKKLTNENYVDQLSKVIVEGIEKKIHKEETV